ncbi:MAG: hypothetical protein IKZ34_00435 [Alphaproteobacteria bacterium]|nr:hypothetical protein [Alphaproteobacteria bacterium]
MLKQKLILICVKVILWCVALGVGIWYLSSSLSGASLTYTSVDNFLLAAGVQNGDITTANGCFLCSYVSELFSVLGLATDRFWNAMLNALLILLAIGFGIFLTTHTISHLYKSATVATRVDSHEKNLEFKGWFDKVWKQGVRVLIVAVLIGSTSAGGVHTLRLLSKMTITPVMLVGTEMSMAVTGIGNSAKCYAMQESSEEEKPQDFLNPIVQPLMCIVSNVNSVMLAGAAGGFALMNYSWLGMGGGAMTWVAGLALVLMFLIIGFNLFFEILTVVFKLVFVIIFMPLLLAAYAFEGTWSAAKGLLGKGIDMLVSSAVRIVAITLKVLVIYATVSYAADTYFPGPKEDGYNAILPPMLGVGSENPDVKTMAVMNVFSECERVALDDGEMDKEKFLECFYERKEVVEKTYPGAFDFMENGWDFLLLMGCLFFLYFYAISPKIDKLLGKDSKELFDFGSWIKDFGKQMFNLPVKLTKMVMDNMD